MTKTKKDVIMKCSNKSSAEKGGGGMEREKKNSREEELDRFWDIDALIPKRRAPYAVSDTETAEIELEPIASSGTSAEQKQSIPERQESAERHFIPPHTAEEFRNRPAPDLEYTPDNALVRCVRLYRWKSNYRYYEGFVRDAEKLYGVNGAECSRVPFFSYVPQYSQMNRAQLEWYLWWRFNVRKGRFLDTDYSYVLLYAYELINLSDRGDPLTTQKELCKIWVAYRNTFHQLDSYLPEWICDHCLIHRLPPPEVCTGELLSAVMAHCSLKEFYVPSGGKDGYIRALLAFCSNYNYRKSKFCTEEHMALFDSAVMGALKTVTEHMSRDGKLFSKSGMDDSKLTRDAYTGALCSYRIKKRIEVEFCSFSHSHELRFFVTDVVKYTENKIRSALGVRSKLTVYALSMPVRLLLDAYLESTLPKRQTPSHKQDAARAEAEVYEKLYDLPQKPLSLRDAAEIERLSWDTTERLVEAFENEGTEPIEEMPQYSQNTPAEAFSVPSPKTQEDYLSLPASMPTHDGGSDALSDAMQPYLPFLWAVRDRDAVAQKQVASDAGSLIEVMADEINAIAADLIGDILLEESDGVFAVIEDYRDILDALLN